MSRKEDEYRPDEEQRGEKTGSAEFEQATVPDGLVDRSIFAPRDPEESRVAEGEGVGGVALGATESAVRGASGAYRGVRGRLTRAHLAPAAALACLMFGLTLVGVSAPWSPFGPGGGTSSAQAQASDELAQAEETTSEEGTSGGFTPSVLPDTKASDDSSQADSASEDAASSEPLPEANPGDSAADQQKEETTIDAGSEGGSLEAATCYDYAGQQEAQSALESGATQLDEDGDGQACEVYFGTGVDDGAAFAETGGVSPLVLYGKGAGLILAGGGLLGLLGVGARRAIQRPTPRA